MGTGTPSFGKRAHTKTHTACRRCGKITFHNQKHECSSCGYPCVSRESGRAPAPASLMGCTPHSHPPALPPPNFPLCSRAGMRRYHWAHKALRRRTEGTGRMKTLKTLPRRFKNGFQENSVVRVNFVC